HLDEFLGAHYNRRRCRRFRAELSICQQLGQPRRRGLADLGSAALIPDWLEPGAQGGPVLAAPGTGWRHSDASTGGQDGRPTGGFRWKSSTALTPGSSDPDSIRPSAGG